MFVGSVHVCTTLVFNQPHRSTQPGHPSEGRCSEYGLGSWAVNSYAALDISPVIIIRHKVHSKKNTHVKYPWPYSVSCCLMEGCRKHCRVGPCGFGRTLPFLLLCCALCAVLFCMSLSSTWQVICSYWRPVKASRQWYARFLPCFLSCLVSHSSVLASNPPSLLHCTQFHSRI